MISGLKDYKCEYEPNLNRALMNKSYDASLVDYIVDAWKSLEVVPQIKFVGYEYNEHESEIDVNKYIFRREKKKKKKERRPIKYIADDRVGLLTVHLEITMLEKDPSTNEYSYRVYPISKSMLVPIQDEEGYYRIKSKKFYLIDCGSIKTSLIAERYQQPSI